MEAIFHEEVDSQSSKKAISQSPKHDNDQIDPLFGDGKGYEE